MNTQIMDIQTSETSTIYAETIAEEEVYYTVEIEGEIGETAFHFRLNALLYSLLEAYFLPAQT